MTTIVLTPTIHALPAGPVLPGQEITTTFELLNGTASDSDVVTLTFTDTNGSEWTLDWVTDTDDAVDLSGSVGPLNAGGATPFSPSTIDTQLSAGSNFSGTITSVVPLTWVSGDYVAQLVASGVGLTAPQTLSASVHVIEDVLTLNSELPEEVTQGQKIVPLTAVAAGGATPYTFSAVGLPTGLSINSSTGVISGTPTVQGKFSTTITVTDNYSDTASQTFQYIVLPNVDIIVIESLAQPNNQMFCPGQQFWEIGVPIPAGLVAGFNAANDLTAPIVYSAIGLPLGISLSSSTGTLSGTPVNAQTSTPLVITATDANGIVSHCGFEVVISYDGTNFENQTIPPIVQQQLPPCLAIGLAGGLPTQPSLTTIITDSVAAMAAAYPP